MTIEKEVTLSCSYSGASGEEWSAYVSFEIHDDECIVHVSGDGSTEDTKYDEIVERFPVDEYSWNKLASSLLDLSSGSIYGDLRDHVQVNGLEGFRADLFALCWQREDEVDYGLKEFLITCGDDDVDWMESHLSSMSLDALLMRMQEYVDLSVRPPLDECARLLDEENCDLLQLIATLESEPTIPAPRIQIGPHLLDVLEPWAKGERGYDTVKSLNFLASTLKGRGTEIIQYLEEEGTERSQAILEKIISISKRDFIRAPMAAMHNGPLRTVKDEVFYAGLSEGENAKIGVKGRSA